jgi:hypothetical protein
MYQVILKGSNMRKLITVTFIAGIFTALLLAATRTDNRNSGDQYPIAKYSATQMSLVASDANDVTTTIYNVNGLLERIDIIVSDSNQSPAGDCTVTLEDEGGTVLKSFETILMTPAARTIKLAPTDFDPIPLCGDVVVTVDPNTTGPTGVTWTFDLNIFVQ